MTSDLALALPHLVSVVPCLHVQQGFHLYAERLLIREEILDELGLSVSEAAKVLDVRRATLSDLIERQRGVVGGNGAAD